jgi:hypothetical protein
MQKLILIVAVILLLLQPALSIDLPNMSITSESVVGNILYEPLTMLSMAVLMIIAMIMA